MTTHGAAGERAVRVQVNGTDYERQVAPRVTLADFLREELGILSVHLGCEQGVCGCCTVLLNGRGVRSCLMLAVQAAGQRVETVESLSANPMALHPIQQSFQDHFAVQCGFCTPAMLLRAREILESDGDLSRQTLRERMSGVLCRCGGYQNILDAIEAAASQYRDPLAASVPMPTEEG